MDIQKLLALKGWRRRGLAALLGVCAAAALPPFYALPLLIPAFSGLLLLVSRAATRRQAFYDGWWWGLGHFTAGLYWICISLWVEPEKFAWLTPVALFGLPSVLAIYIGLVTLLLYCTGARGGGRGTNPPFLGPRSSILIFAALWVGAEYLRAHLFSGFPWNLTGYVWTASDITLQVASVTGVYGLSWMTVVIASMPSLFVSEGDNARMPNIVAILLLAGIAVFGVWRLETHPTRFTGVKARIVQANVPQNLKWDAKAAMEGLKKHMRLTRSPGIRSVNLVLWPETAVPYPIARETALTQDLGGVLPGGALLLTGGLRSNGYDNSGLWNSVFAIDWQGKIVAEYDKHHLVPFGEYIPLRGVPVLRGLIDFVAKDIGDFSRGPGPRTLAIGPYPAMSPLVCYEAVFPDEATDGTHRAQWLLSLTDDAWFGLSSGPYQDVEMARMRAVEQGLPLLRSANTGISAGFDAYGRTLAWLPPEEEGMFDLFLPEAAQQPTLFSRYPGAWVFFMAIGSALFLCLRTKNRGATL
jgi:apolipoprotein N-acyltransferase